ncbi:hypothetical protein CQA53_07460 [Helicobacter didelphidarum]|uniref:NADH-ubiquinone oxidoreductase subunit E n=1 Tax=Helicobacter didelphidarum TaxID=2040648 RepID=A0A3D8II25_9HELI|nr:NADH-ubiquinone oxidoreductase subunit E family protein [Helicobacter didelphidarum]RDU64899.1 hypothetical protein CQA53_07460 [Helicobacter didelphidarum]
MKRFDLRHLKNDFYNKLGELIDSELTKDEVGIFLFEKGDHENVAKSAMYVQERGHILMNSLQFNHVDWTIIVKKVS